VVCFVPWPLFHQGKTQNRLGIEKVSAPAGIDLRKSSSQATDRDVLVHWFCYTYFFIYFTQQNRPPLWSSGQNFYLQIQRSGFDSRSYQIFWVMDLERGPLSLVSTIEELLERKNRGCCLENREYGRRDPSRCPRDILYPKKFALTSPTNGGRTVGIVRSRTQATKFSF
jgi:hypothetical protein